MAIKITTIRMESETLKRVKHLAVDENKNVSILIKEAIDMLFKDRRLQLIKEITEKKNA